MKPLIGVMPLWDEEKKSIWMLPGYLEGISAAGDIPVIFPLDADRSDLVRLTKMCGGILFTGGQDVSPEFYGQKPLENCISCKMRDEMEQLALKQAIQTNKPLLGICRGLQFINAALGGNLYQDIPTELPSTVAHKQQPPYDTPHTRSLLSRVHRCLSC